MCSGHVIAGISTFIGMDNYTSRREFLKKSSIASAALLIPNFLKATMPVFTGGGGKPRVLVVIQLSGGNDGLNCVVPYRNDVYYKLRPKLGIRPDEVIRLDDEVGLNPNLAGIADLFNNGEAVILNSVGYPNPNRSHFRSMDIWQSGSGSNEYLSSGWLGRVLDSECGNNYLAPHSAVEVSDSLSLAMKGEQISGFAIRDPRAIRRDKENEFIDRINAHSTDHDHPQADFLHKVLTGTRQSTDYLKEVLKKYRSARIFPGGEFGQQLKTIAELIISESDTRIYYVSMSGFDTHAAQRNVHDRNLSNWSGGLKAFTDELKEHNRYIDTLVMTFSEFGRRVEQNAGNGTDHGTANNMYIVGGGLKKAGMFNPLPDLEDLEDGDLKYQTDFRAVYASIIDNWLMGDSTRVLQGNYGHIDFV